MAQPYPDFDKTASTVCILMVKVTNTMSISKEPNTLGPRQGKKRSDQKGKTLLVEAVRRAGYSARKSAKAVDAFFDLLASSLGRGESVDLPFGTLSVRDYKGSGRRKLQWAVNVNTKKKMYALMRRPGDRKVVRLDPNDDFDLSTEEERRDLNEEFDLPTEEERRTCEEREALRLMQVLRGGREVPPDLVAEVNRLIAFQNATTRSLLNRLHELVRRGRILTPEEIVYWVRHMSWY
jgi:nucleoid DNA-binding protein